MHGACMGLYGRAAWCTHVALAASQRALACMAVGSAPGMTASDTTRKHRGTHVQRLGTGGGKLAWGTPPTNFMTPRLAWACWSPAPVR